jgi:twitching motility protein PilT
MRDKETIEIALEAAETGHLVPSTLHTIDASKTVARIIGAFPMGEQQIIRNRLGKSFRAIISQRLIPRKDGSGRVAIVEILKSTLRTREYIEKGEQDGKTLLEAMADGDTEGMQHFDGEIEKLVRAGVVDMSTGLALRISGTCGSCWQIWELRDGIGPSFCRSRSVRASLPDAPSPRATRCPGR